MFYNILKPQSRVSTQSLKSRSNVAQIYFPAFVFTERGTLTARSQ